MKKSNENEKEAKKESQLQQQQPHWPNVCVSDKVHEIN